MEKILETALKIALVALVYWLVYTAARRNNRDRPWLWGLGAVLLCPGFLILLVAYLARGGTLVRPRKGDALKPGLKDRSLIGMMAFLCPQCRQVFTPAELEQETCARCGRKV